jgi:16S rRNA (cytosine967-C5)-methyltransferase
MAGERLLAFKRIYALLSKDLAFSQGEPPFSSLPSMTKAMCFGFCRHYFRLEAIALCLLDKKPKSLDIWIALLMGLYQLHYMELAEYAVVKETVALVDKAWARGLVNAVLRRFCRERQRILQQVAAEPAFIYGHPAWFLSRVQEAWPKHWQDLIKANDDHPPMSLRINQRKTSVAAYLMRLQQHGIIAKAHPIAPEGIVLESPQDLDRLPGFKEGEVSVQDVAPQLAPLLLSLAKGQRVLDACCAPGGKTCHILESQPDLEALFALDIDKNRLKRVQENLDRLQLSAHLLLGDAQMPNTWWDQKPFDRILLDAPCSATGVIRRHADIKLLRKEEEIHLVCQRQQALLQALWPLLKPGGIMLYATCSVLPQENEEQIKTFLAGQSDCRVLEANLNWSIPFHHGYQIFPGDDAMDGFFYSILAKQA